METTIYALLAAFSVSLISFVGIFVLLGRFNKLQKFSTGLVAFAAGALLGDAFLHLLGENIEEFGFEPRTSILIFAGVLLMLLIEAYFHCSHDSAEEIHDHKHHVLAKVNIVGDALHNFLDGLAIAAGFIIAPATGIATTFAIVLHEIPQELADAAVLKYSGLENKKILKVNFITALTAVAGTVVGLAVNSAIGNAEQYLIPLVVGQFIYIALADLLPEIHKKTGVKKYVFEVGMFVLGIAIMYSLLLLE